MCLLSRSTPPKKTIQWVNSGSKSINFSLTCVTCGWIHFVNISLTSVYPLPGSRFEVFGKRLPLVPILHFIVPAGRD